MNPLNYIKDYKNDENLRRSFNELAISVFGISFEDWYQRGFWNNRYIPFSYADGDKIVANVSVNILDLVIKSEKKRALQIGTVMTHPDYRKRGLSTSLMNKVIDKYKNKCDFMYLFANHTVLDFYPKFGFKRVNEYQYSLEYSPIKLDNTSIRKLNCNNAEDVKFIHSFATKRVPVSKRFGTENTQGILMFHCLNVFHNNIFYLEPEDVIAIFKKENKQINIFDILSKKNFDIDDVFSKIADEGVNKIVFHYTPDYKNLNTESTIFNGSEGLFVRENGTNHFPLQIKHPLLAQA